MNQKVLSQIFQNNQTPAQIDDKEDDELQEDIIFHSADVEIAPKGSVAPLDADDKLTDADYSRRVLQNLITRGQELVSIAMEKAEDGNHPRNVEVAANTLTAVAELTDKLVDLHNKVNNTSQITSDNTGNTYINNQNKTVVVTTQELLNEVLKDDSNILEIE